MKTVPDPFAFSKEQLPVQKSVETDGFTTAYWEYGQESPEAPTLIFIHGFRGDHHGLEYIVASLDENFHCIIPDLPGFGLSADFPATASISAYASWLSRFVSILSLKNSVVVGHSFGSIVVTAAIAAGLPAERVVLINPIADNALKGPRAVATRLAVAYYRLAERLPERVGYGLLRWKLIVRVMSITMAKTRNRVLRRWIHNQHDLYFSSFHSRKAVMQAFATSVSHDVREYQASLNMPILLIVGERDDITPLKAQYAFASTLPHATLRVISDVGHLIHYEAAEEAATLIAEFVKDAPQ